MSENIYRPNGGSLLLYGREIYRLNDIPEKIYRLNEGGLLLYVREDIPTQ